MSLANLLRRLDSVDRSNGCPDLMEQERWARKVDEVRRRIEESAAPVQLAFIRDRSQYCLALCSRQCGKGWSVARMMVDTALERPGNVVMYVRKTLQLAKQTMWSEPRDGLPIVLRELDLQQGLDYTLNLSTTTVRFTNGSEIRFDGIDRSAWQDVRGKKYALIVLDEMQEQDEPGLVQALEADIPYCFMMFSGRFVGIGTPNHLPVGRFHDICEDVDGKGTGWAVHRWTSKDLSDRTPVWKEMLAWKERFKVADDNPKWLRDGLGLWASDDSELMLAVLSSGLWTGRQMDIPQEVPSRSGAMVPRSKGRNGELVVMAGLDFGFVAPCGLVVGSVSKEEGVLRELHSESRNGLITQDLAAWLKEMMSLFGISRFFGDCAEPGKIEELRRSYGIPIEACDKTDYDIKLSQMRGALLEGRLLVADQGSLRDELRTLAPCPKALSKGEFRPKPGQPDHLFDGLRYLFNGAYKEFIMTPDAPLDQHVAREQEILRLAQQAAQMERERARGLATRSGRVQDHRNRR